MRVGEAIPFEFGVRVRGSSGVAAGAVGEESEAPSMLRKRTLRREYHPKTGPVYRDNRRLGELNRRGVKPKLSSKHSGPRDCGATPHASRPMGEQLNAPNALLSVNGLPA